MTVLALVPVIVVPSSVGQEVKQVCGLNGSIFFLSILFSSRYESQMIKIEAVDSVALWEPIYEPVEEEEEEELINLQNFDCLETSR